MKSIVQIFYLFPLLLYSQESEILKKILTEECGSNFFFLCDKPETFFDSEDFAENVDSEFPIQISLEIEENAKGGVCSNSWDLRVLSSLNLPSALMLAADCQTSYAMTKHFKDNQKRQDYFQVSCPVFDNEKIYCLVSLTQIKYSGSASGYSVILKKVEGNWEIVMRFNHWLT